MKIIKYFFEFISVISLFCIFKIIGIESASNLGSIIGKFFGPLFRSKSLIKQNVKTGLGNIDERKEKKHYKNLKKRKHISFISLSHSLIILLNQSYSFPKNSNQKESLFTVQLVHTQQKKFRKNLTFQ